MPDDVSRLKALFAKSQKSISAIGDETRQAILMTLLDGPCEGMRVGEITKHTHLSQPAVSHHLKILCDANMLAVRKVGTMNFYQLNPDKTEITTIRDLCQGILDALCCYQEHSSSR